MTAMPQTTNVAEADALKRAMPLQRLLSGGMDWADATTLHREAGDGIPWDKAALRLGDVASVRAEAALEAGRTATARSGFLRASASYRFGQVPLTDEQQEKHDMYTRLIACFGKAGALMKPPAARVHVTWEGRRLSGWLLLPAGVQQPPVVIQFGGFDGWREEYYDNGRYLLERGIGVLLADLPGQGETRLFNGVYMDPNIGQAVSAFTDFLLADPRCGGRVGIWGNSLGGFLAALAAAYDDRLSACCVNGGTVRPAEILDRFPRYIGKIQALYGSANPNAARAALESLTLTRGRLSRLTCPLQVVHGTPDQVFLIENARRLFDEAGSQRKVFSEFPDGDHCIYNRAHERNCLVSDWFAEVLAS